MSLNRQKNVLVILVMTAVLATACATPTPAVSPLPTTTALVSPFVSPVEGQPTPTFAAPKPRSGLGTVTAVLFNQYLNKPYADRYIYLGSIKQMQGENGGKPVSFVEVDLQADPSGHTDVYGRFVIENVVPGKYALVLQAPNLRQSLLVDVTTNANISVEVKPDGISDLGVLKISQPE